MTAHYRTSNAALTQLISSADDLYPANCLRMVQADLFNEAETQALFSLSTASASSGNSTRYPVNEHEAGWGEVEIVVINHGVYVSADVSLKDMPLKQWERTLGDNLTSSFLVAREYMRGLDRGLQSAVARPQQGEGRTHNENEWRGEWTWAGIWAARRDRIRREHGGKIRRSQTRGLRR